MTPTRQRSRFPSETPTDSNRVQDKKRLRHPSVGLASRRALFFSSVLSAALEEARGSCVVIRRQNRVRTGLCLPCRATVLLQSNRLSVMHGAVHICCLFRQAPGSGTGSGHNRLRRVFPLGARLSRPATRRSRGRLAVLVGIAMEHGDRMSNLGFWSQLGTSTVIGHGERNTVARFEDFGRGAVA